MSMDYEEELRRAINWYLFVKSHDGGLYFTSAPTRLEDIRDAKRNLEKLSQYKQYEERLEKRYRDKAT